MKDPEGTTTETAGDGQAAETTAAQTQAEAATATETEAAAPPAESAAGDKDL